MIYIVIPVHNRKQYTLRCLTCLAQQTTIDFRIIVVDDGSTDGTGDAVRSHFPDTIILTGDGSLWWTGATNLGIQYAIRHWSADEENFILTLNDDTEVQVDYVETLLTAYRTNEPCIVGSVSVDIRQPNRLLYAGTGLDLWFAHVDNWAESRFQNDYELLKSSNPYFPSESLPGRGMLIPSKVFDEIGLFDQERFQHYMADIDFSISARKAGFPLIISGASAVYEHSEATGFNARQQVTPKQFWRALSSIKSPINYPVRYHFAQKHAPLKLLYFGLDMMRIVGGYFFRQGRHWTKRAAQQ